MLRDPLVRYGATLAVVAAIVACLPFYDRSSLFAVVNMVVLLSGVGTAFCGAVRMDRRGG